MRLNAYLARAGIASRRGAEELIRAGRVRVNGEVAGLATFVEGRDRVEVDGTEGINIWVPVHDETAAVVRLASAGVGVTPGSPFTLLPGDGDHVRVTVGLAREGHAELAAEIAAAARTPGWRVGVR